MGNDETEYKLKILNLLTDAYAVEAASRVSALELVIQDGTSVECDLVLISNWKSEIPEKTKMKRAVTAERLVVSFD